MEIVRKTVRNSSANQKALVRWKGAALPIYKERGIWRIKSRRKGAVIDASLQTGNLALARKAAMTLLERQPPAEMGKTHGTLEDAVKAYLSMPKRCSDESAAFNVARLRHVVKVTWGLPLDKVKIMRLPDLWPEYVAKAQKRKAADYSDRSRKNYSINSTIRNAASCFRPKLARHFRNAGIILPADAVAIEYLPEMPLTPSVCDDTALCASWETLADSDRRLWLTLGLARFAGLRRKEILNCRGKWVIGRGTGAVVQLRDREEDDVWTKTGAQYHAPILHPKLAEYLLAIDPDKLVIEGEDREDWIKKEPQLWLRPFIGAARKPLHRLRGLYADHCARLTEDAVLARQAGLKAASEALGHTSTAVTERHYTTERE